MRAFLSALFVTTFSLPLFAQQFGAAENLGPQIPTPQIIVEKMLEAGRVTPADVVYDLAAATAGS